MEWKFTYLNTPRSPHVRYLITAYEWDIAGEREDPHRRDGPSGRTFYDHLKHGRRLMVKAGVWPWAIYGPDGKPPRRWWEDGPAVMAWRRWLSAEP